MTGLAVYDFTYRVNWVYAISEKHEDFADMCKNCYGIRINRHHPDNFSQCTYAYNNNRKANFVFIWLKKMNIPAITHETIHGAQFIFKDCGIKLSEDTDEAFAYYVESMMTQVMNIKNKRVWKSK